MEEADKLLLVSMKSLKAPVIGQLEDFTAETFIQTVILCFERISNMLDPEDNFVDVKFLKKAKLSEATHRYKVCQKFVEYLKTLGYLYDTSFNLFLYPNVKDCRKLLSFLFELIFKEDDNSGNQQSSVSSRNEHKTLVRERLAKWHKKPWLMPDFLKGNKSLFVGSGNLINVQKDIDFQRVAQSKSKKTKGVYTMMSKDLQVASTADNYQKTSFVYANQQSIAAFQRGVSAIMTKSQDNVFTRGQEDDEEDNKSGTSATLAQTNILDNFFTNVESKQASISTTGVVELPTTASVAQQQEVETNEKTIRDVLEEREQELKDIEQLHEIKQSAFMEALVEDITETTTKTKKTEQPKSTVSTAAASGQAAMTVSQEMNVKQSSEIVQQEGDQQTATNVVQQQLPVAAQAQQQQMMSQAAVPVQDSDDRFNLEALKAEMEPQINQQVSQLDEFKKDIASSQVQFEKLTEKKKQFEETKKENVDKLKSLQKESKKKSEVLQELKKLGTTDIRSLQKEVHQSNLELEELRDQWEEYKKPISDEIFTKKQEIQDKRVEYKYKNEKIKDIKKEIKEAVLELDHKKQVLQKVQQEWEQMPKDINRNQYLKRINEIIGNLKGQKGEIRSILEDVKGIQKETQQVVKQIKEVDSVVEDKIFVDAKKDKLALEIYKEVQKLKDDFDVLITGVQEENKFRTQIRDIDTKMEDFRIKYKNKQEIYQLEQDLGAIQQENTQLSTKVNFAQ